MTFHWQVPISGQLKTGEVAHLFVRSGKTNVQVRTACGKLVTPGFAKPATKRSVKCKKCEGKETK